MADTLRRERRASEMSDDLPDYVTAFKTSSDRARFAFYIVIVATVLIAITNYNVQDDSWPRRRLKAWFDEPLPGAVARGPGIAPDKARREIIREEYLKQFTSRGLFTESPIPGVSIDANDLGILGGIALTLVMLVFLLCVIREHENLYLAFYKLRMICEREGDACSDGQSDANLLYHSLAMSQVFSSPPTLARWQRRGVLRHFGILFFAPPLVYLWVFLTDLETQAHGAAYGEPVWRQLVFEAIVLAILMTISVATWLQTRSMAMRWQRAFFRVNRQRRLVDQMSLREWLQIGPRPDAEQRLLARLRTTLVDRIDAPVAADEDEVPIVPVVEPVGDGRVSHDALRKVSAEIRKRGDAAAAAHCALHGLAYEGLLRFVPSKNTIVGNCWTVAGNWRFQYSRRPIIPCSSGSLVSSQPTMSPGTNREPG